MSMLANPFNPPIAVDRIELKFVWFINK